MDRTDIVFKFLTDLMNEDKWQLVKQEDDIITEKINIAGSEIGCYRANAFINYDPEELLQHVWKMYDDSDAVKKNDNSITFYQVVAKPQEDIKISYQVNSLGWPIWPRDMLYLQTIRTAKNNSKWIIMYSVESEDFPPKPDQCVRANITISAFGFVAENNGCRIYRLAHVDPAGSIPPSIVNIYADKISGIVRDLRRDLANR